MRECNGTDQMQGLKAAWRARKDTVVEKVSHASIMTGLLPSNVADKHQESSDSGAINPPSPDSPGNPALDFTFWDMLHTDPFAVPASEKSGLSFSPPSMSPRTLIVVPRNTFPGFEGQADALEIVTEAVTGAADPMANDESQAGSHLMVTIDAGDTGRGRRHEGHSEIDGDAVGSEPGIRKAGCGIEEPEGSMIGEEAGRHCLQESKDL
jgi:hypothetical protein